MRREPILLAILMLSLTACEKSFDEKYQDNLDQLHEEAEAIESGVNLQLAEGAEADKIIEGQEKSDSAIKSNNGTAR